MSFEQSPSPVVPAPRAPRPWGAAAAVALAVLLLGLLLLGGPPAVGPGQWLALAVLAAAAGLLALRGRGHGPASLPPAAPADAAGPDPEAPFRVALERLPEPVLVVSGLEPDDYAGRRVLFANQAARELLRLPAEGGLLVTGLRDPDVLEAVDEALFGGVERVTGLEPGGPQPRIWRAWTSPLPPGPDGARRALVRLRDETDAVRMERMRADFLANASHELRTPLASLAGFIETLKGHAREDPRARDRFLDIMSIQAERMRRLIGDLMSLSRVELNEHVPPAGRADVALAAGDVLDATALLAAQRKVGVRLDAPGPGEAAIVGDRDEIVQVIQNLLDNAVKYAPEGSEVELSVRAGVSAREAVAPVLDGASRLSLLTPDRASGARYALVRVRDHGPGMAREHLPRLTERFYRIEGQKSGERAGTGLGLAIVKHIVSRHRGGLAVESAPGQGTVMSAYFPLSSEVRPAVQRNKTVAEPS